MYLDHFKLSDYPFIQSARDELYFVTDEGQARTDLIQHWIASGHGMLLVTGAAGVGRSALVHHAIAQSELAVKQVNLSGLPLDSEEFLNHIVLELGIETSVTGRLPLQHAIRTHLKQSVDIDSRVCLVVDNAQSLDVEKLEFLQSLGTDHSLYLPLSLVVLIGDETMGRAELKQRKDGSQGLVSRVVTVTPMTEQQCGEFIEHRLWLVSESEEELFPRNVIRMVHEQTRGNPAQVNALCDEVLLIAAAEQQTVVSGTHLSKAVKQLGWTVRFSANKTAVATKKKPAKRPVNSQVSKTRKALQEKARMRKAAKLESNVRKPQRLLENSVHQLLQNVTTIGRAPDCGIRINEEDISPYQALIVKTGSGMVIRNEGGEVPIFVNSTKVENANLKEGDKVRIGAYELEVQADNNGGVSLVSTPALRPSSSV